MKNGAEERNHGDGEQEVEDRLDVPAAAYEYDPLKDDPYHRKEYHLLCESVREVVFVGEVLLMEVVYPAAYPAQLPYEFDRKCDAQDSSGGHQCPPGGEGLLRQAHCEYDEREQGGESQGKCGEIERRVAPPALEVSAEEK